MAARGNGGNIYVVLFMSPYLIYADISATQLQTNLPGTNPFNFSQLSATLGSLASSQEKTVGSSEYFWPVSVLVRVMIVRSQSL
jgi:hypothetical protein